MEMQVPIAMPTPYYSEGSVLREFMDAQEQNHTSGVTRLSQDTPVNGNVIAHYGSTAQRPEAGQTQSFGEPTIGESGPIPRTSTSVIPFPTPFIDSAAQEGLIQEPRVGAQGQQGQQGQPGNNSQNIQPSMETVQDPGPSNQHPQESQRRQSRHAPDTALEPGQSAADAQEPHRSLYSSDTEGQILRDFVDAQEQLPPELRVHNPYEGRASGSIRGEAHPRSSRAFQKSRAVDGTVLDPGPSKRRSRHRSRSHNEVMISDSATTEEVIRQLVEQRKENNTLRALRLALERVDTENQRVLALDQNNIQTIEQFSMLNDSRLAAQQEALKTGSELRLYQFQLESAHKEIARAQEALRTLENQRDEAEEAASRARARARKHAQERMIAVAKEEGRRLGFEAGLRRAQEEAAYLNLGSRRVLSSRVRSESVSQVTALPRDFDLERAISSPVRQRTLHTRRQSIPRGTSTPPQPQVQSPTPPESEASVEGELQVPHAPESAPENDRAASPEPSMVRYPVSIPPASEIERQTSQNQYLSESSQPWVTAREYHQMTETQPSPETPFQANFPEGSRNVVTFAPVPLQGNPNKKKRSWFHRTLTRPWRKASRTVPEAPSTWYLSTSSAKPPPTVHVRDFAAGAPEFPQASTDNVSISTRLSQFEITSPPPNTPGQSLRNNNESERSLAGSGPKGRRRVRERTPLQVINEDPVDLNEAPTHLRRDITPVSPSMGQIRELLGDTRSNYSDPKAVEEWRRSSASVSVTTQTNQSRIETPPDATSRQAGPPRRRPVRLTVPAPLAPQATNAPSLSTMHGSSSQNPALLGVSDTRPTLQRNPTSGTVYGITVEPPSRSPSEAPNSARQPQENLLSPNLSYAHSLRSMGPSLQNVGPSSARGSAAPLIFNRSRPVSVTGHSQVSHLPSKSPMTMASSRSLPQTDRPPSQSQGPVDYLHRSSVASHATANAPRPMTDNASIRSVPRSVNAGRNTPQQGYPNPAPVNSNPSLHRRTVSDSTYLTPNALSVGNGAANGVHDLYRVASNQSMSSIHSANSQYSHFDPNTYVEPTALYGPVSVGSSRQGERQRTTSNATGTTLSYISRT